MKSKMGYCQVKFPRIRVPSMTPDLLIKEHVGDLVPQNYNRLIENKFEIKHLETSIFLERTLHIFNLLLEKIELLLANLENQEISDQSIFFLRTMKFFMILVIIRIKCIPKREKKVESYRNMWHANQKARFDENDLFICMVIKHLRCEENLNNMISEHTRLSNIMTKKIRKYKNETKNAILEGEKMQTMAHKNWITTHKNWMETLKESNNNMENLCMENSLEETELLSEIHKMEAELAVAMSEYDLEVGGKIQEYKYVKKKFRSIDRRLMRLQNYMEIQLDICHSLILEQEELLLKTLSEKLEKFVMLRSTKIIQRWWRKIYWRWRIKPVNGKKDKMKKKKKK